MEIPWFHAGRGRPSLFSASDMNVLVALLRSLGNITVQRGEADQVIYADGNLKIIIGGSETGGGLGGALRMFRLKSVQGDYVTLRAWDGTTEGTR